MRIFVPSFDATSITCFVRRFVGVNFTVRFKKLLVSALLRPIYVLVYMSSIPNFVGKTVVGKYDAPGLEYLLVCQFYVALSTRCRLAVICARMR